MVDWVWGCVFLRSVICIGNYHPLPIQTPQSSRTIRCVVMLTRFWKNVPVVTEDMVDWVWGCVFLRSVICIGNYHPLPIQTPQSSRTIRCVVILGVGCVFLRSVICIGNYNPLPIQTPQSSRTIRWSVILTRFRKNLTLFWKPRSGRCPETYPMTSAWIVIASERSALQSGFVT
jgi:hypothetical protein